MLRAAALSATAPCLRFMSDGPFAPVESSLTRAAAFYTSDGVIDVKGLVAPREGGRPRPMCQGRLGESRARQALAGHEQGCRARAEGLVEHETGRSHGGHI